ncbi:MAG: sugar ABC transporter ATP-binding protein [Candidatus Dormibacteria bacterium]
MSEVGGALRQPGPRSEQRFGVRGAAHSYAGVLVLYDVDFTLRRGSAHALVGQNGAGKSTLIRILTGAIQPGAGGIYLDGEALRLESPAHAQRLGIGVVHQDVQLFPLLDVATNIYAVSQPLPRRHLTGSIDWPAIGVRVGSELERLGIRIDPRASVADLNLAERKLVEIARATIRRPRFLILDEPTASLEPHAAGQVLDLLDRLRSDGIGLCFISHRLDEVRQIADEITVLRDGRVAGRLEAGATEDDMVRLMFGADRSSSTGLPDHLADTVQEEVALSIRDLRLPGGAAPVALDLRRGEILGITGLLGSGVETVVRMVGGARPFYGSLSVYGKRVRITSPRQAIAAGIGFIPEDRKNAGLVPEQSVAVNISLASLREVGRVGLVSARRLLGRAQRYGELLGIKAPSLGAHVKTLSGGNQQKVVVAKCLAAGTRILSIEEPTHGVDVLAKAQIHLLLREFAAQGGSVLVASTDVSELLHLCDRIAVFRRGSVAAVLGSRESGHVDVVLAGVRDPEGLIGNLMGGEPTLHSHGSGEGQKQRSRTELAADNR